MSTIKLKNRFGYQTLLRGGMIFEDVKVIYRVRWHCQLSLIEGCTE